MGRFEGLTQEMFSVYVPEKWSSNVHNLPRMRNKDRMMSLASEVDEAMADHLSGLSRAGSDEVPNITNHRRVEAQWVYWFRNAEARQALSSFLERTQLTQAALFNLAAHDKHAVMALQMDRRGLWTGLRLAPGASVDRRNLAAKLSQSWERDHLMELLKALPEEATVTIGTQEHPASTCDAAFLTTLAAELEPSGQEIRMGILVPSEAAHEAKEILVDDVSAALLQVMPLYRYTAWSRENDLIEAGRQIQQQKADKRRQATDYITGQKVRFIAGLMQGKQGVVQNIESKTKVRVLVGTLSVVVAGTEISALA